MKNIAERLLCFATLFACYATVPAQDIASTVWALNSTALKTAITAGGIIAQDQKISNLFIIRDYFGVNGSQHIYCSGSGLVFWPNTTTQINSCYTEFSVSLREGITAFTIDSVTFYLGNSGGSNNLRAHVYYGTEANSTLISREKNILVPNTALQKKKYTPGATVYSGSRFTLRIYPWCNGGVASGIVCKYDQGDVDEIRKSCMNERLILNSAQAH